MPEVQVSKIPVKGHLILVFISTLIFFTYSGHNLYSQEAQQPVDTAATPAAGTEPQTTQEGPLAASEEVIQQGQTLFRNYCAQCHAVHQEVVGPALAGITERRELSWLQSFIRNSQQMIQQGDETAVQLYEEYNQLVMPPHDFSDEEINSILAYIQQETQASPQVAAQPGQEGAPPGTADAREPAVSTDFLIVVMIALVVILVLILVVMIMLVNTLTTYLKQREGLDESEIEVVQQRISVKRMVKSPAFIFGVTFIFTAVLLKTVIDGLYHIGIQEGYQPTQPILFSHKVHAGDFEIPCEYCHTGVMDSKNANIPSVNICMNCHSAIIKVTGSDEPSAEIEKIYDAMENNTPIEWVRVHNLPDLVYFNHAQHYNVGKIECETCHGPVEEMEVMKQYADLTMGWCIDCHRTNEVNKNNAYYDKLMDVHENAEGGKLLVEDIGGLECSKCHY